MCGIFGIISTHKSIKEDELRLCTKTMTHRGPDYQDVYLSEDKSVGLGHTRLSILDLSDRANQPIHSSCGRYVMTFNGEVYNFKEVAQELRASNDLSFASTGDTEVVLQAFIQWGHTFVDRLNGMFALAIWDKKKKECHLYRDRMGIKPLYYYQYDNLFVFGSELKSLVAYPEVKKNIEIDSSSVQNYMHLGYIPEPKSIYKHIFKFPSGTYGVVGDSSPLVLSPYWKIDSLLSKDPLKDEETAEKQLEDLLNHSVQKRLVSDVPLGTFLSGGIDSSLVTSLAAKHTTGTLNTFSIGFNDSKFDESKYARQVAKHLGTNHTEYTLSEKEAIPYLDEMSSTFDEPFADTSAIPTMLISKLAAEKVKVILTGDGGDELFLGYGSYDWAQRMAFPILQNSISKKLTSALLKKGNSRMKRAAHLFSPTQSTTLRSHIFSQEQYFFAQDELSKTMLNSSDQSYFDYEDDLSVPRSAQERQALFDLKYYLKDDLLVKVDRSSMKYGLECRVPLLDHQLVAFSANLDQTLKKKKGVSKYLLKKILYKHVPATYFDRPKWGFGIPVASWLKNDLRYLISDHLDKKTTTDLGYFNYDEVRSLLSRFENGESYLYNRLWLVISLHKWVKENSELC